MARARGVSLWLRATVWRAAARPVPFPHLDYAVSEFEDIGEGVCVHKGEYYRMAQLKGFGGEYVTKCPQACVETGAACVGYSLIPGGRTSTVCTLILDASLERAHPPPLPPVAVASAAQWGWLSNLDWDATGPVTGTSVPVNKGWASWRCFKKGRVWCLSVRVLSGYRWCHVPCSCAVVGCFS